jgi:lactoylglutathione lyase
LEDEGQADLISERYFHRFMKMVYCGIRVTNLDASLGFYTKALGLEEVRRGDMTEHSRGKWVLLKDRKTGQRLELNWYPKGSQFDTPYSPGEGLDHIGFQVTNVESAYEDLLKKGAAPTHVTPQITDGHQAYVKDPDGNWIELYKR